MLVVKLFVQCGNNMSKIGRKPINIGNAVVDIKGQVIHYKGKKTSGEYNLSDLLAAKLDGKELYITAAQQTSDTNRVWGLSRALISNAIIGSETGFEKQVKINGLGFKAVAMGSKLQFSLGFSHKIDFELPKDVTVEIDKTGQMLTFKSPYKDLLGQVCSDVKALRPVEPYKGTGIMYANQVVRRKAGKTKE